MAYLNHDRGRIYYEVYGEGKPILILNGIMMSTGSWTNFVDALSANNKLILLDFFDQGQSDKVEEDYTQEIQVDLILSLLDHLNIDKINIAGISYGGEVALQFAAKYSDRLDRLVLFNTTAKTSTWLRDIGRAWNLSKDDPLNYYLTTIPIIYSPKFYNENTDWMDNRKEFLVENIFSNKDFMDAMERLTISAEGYDVSDKLEKIKTETLIIAAENDFITPVDEQKLLSREIENSHLVILPSTGHASMYERPLLFASLILGFINVDRTRFGIVE